MESEPELGGINRSGWHGAGGRGERSRCQRGVTAPCPVPSGCTSRESIAPVGWGSCRSPAPCRQAGPAEVLPPARAAQRSRGGSPESIPVPRAPAHGSADALRAARHSAGPQGLRNKELLAELSAAPERSLTCRYRAVAQAGLSQRLGILELRTEGSDII